jgi:hypothetical protein
MNTAVLTKPASTVIVSTGHRVGSNWLTELLISAGLTRIYFPVNANDIKFFQKHAKAPFDILNQVDIAPAVIKGHWLPPERHFPGDYTKRMEFVTIFRDLRDVVVSRAFHVTAMREWEDSFHTLSLKEKMIVVIKKGTEKELMHTSQWLQYPFVYKMRYEEIKGDPYIQLKSLLNYLGLNDSSENVKRAINAASFEKQTGRKPGQDDINSTKRKGVVGDWKNYFDEEIKDYFVNYNGGLWNKLLVELGYENNPDW